MLFKGGFVKFVWHKFEFNGWKQFELILLENQRPVM
jgi:hypothetical protein